MGKPPVPGSTALISGAARAAEVETEGFSKQMTESPQDMVMRDTPGSLFAEEGFTSASENEAHVWSHGVSQRRFFQRAVSAAQAGVASVAASLSVLVGYIAVFGWPYSAVRLEGNFLNPQAIIFGLYAVARSPEFSRYIPAFLAAPLIFVLALYSAGVFYRRGHRRLPYGESWRVVKACARAAVILFLLLFVFVQGEGAQQGWLPSAFCAFVVLLAGWSVWLGHMAVLIAVLALRGIGIDRTRVAIVGDSGAMSEIRTLLNDSQSRYEYVGRIAIKTPATGAKNDSIGTLDDVDALINKHRLDELVLVADPGELDSETRFRMATACWKLRVELLMLTPFYPYFHTAGRPEMLGDIPLLTVERTGLYASRAQLLKRTMDVVISITTLALTSPVFVITAALIRLTSRGPVFFVQERPGLYGRPFSIFKFRSMRSDADSTTHQEAQKNLILEGAAAQTDKSGRAVYGKVGDDPRITTVGRFIRRTSIDELPQLINVLRGEMSLVGPRPSVLYELEHYNERHKQRLNIRPGISGLWQVSGRSHLSFEEMVDLDLKYIETWSLWLDLKILMRTPVAIFRPGQAP